MGWMYRKSVGLSPFRLNISKSGIGYSIGGMGFRSGVSSRGRRYKSFSIPGSGIRYCSSSESRGASLGPGPAFGNRLRHHCHAFGDLAMKLIRTFRTMAWERFLVQKKEGEDSAAIDIHYLADGHVAGTVFLFERAGIEDAGMLPSSCGKSTGPAALGVVWKPQLTFTVVRGHVVGDFRPDGLEAGKGG